jgi:hypothetical protein
MAERQKHGFIFQKEVQNLLGAASTAYTHKWDIEDKDSFTSVKMIKSSGAVEMGSLLRFYQNTNPFTMIIAWHNDLKIIGVESVYFTEEIIKALKGSLSIEDIVVANKTLSISNFPLGSHEQARAYFKQWKKENKTKIGLLTPTGKVDSKSQRRWQCSINQTNWLKLFKTKSSNPIFMGKDFSIGSYI